MGIQRQWDVMPEHADLETSLKFNDRVMRVMPLIGDNEPTHNVSVPSND